MANDEVIQSKRGWIAISRDIDRHWIWLDARRFQMWVQMILWAQYQDGEISIGNKTIRLRRGQFVTTLKVLAGYMRCSKQTVLTFLRVLESSQMIKRDKSAKYTIITIVNYDKYQLSGTNKDPSFERNETTENNQLSDRSVDRKLDPIKERINKKEKISSLSSREENLKFYQEIRDSEDFWAKTSEALSISIEQLKGYAEEFFVERQAKEDFQLLLKDVKSYLFNWLRKKVELQKNREEKINTKQKETEHVTTETDNRRGVDAPTPSRASLSKGIF